MSSQFDTATQVVPDGPGRFTAHIDDQWSVAGRTNGGYLLAVLGRAAGAVGAPHHDVVAATATYLSPVPPGPVGLVVDVLRRGRSTSVLRVRLQTLDDEPRVEALVTCGRLDDANEPFHDGVERPSLPPLADCPRLPPYFGEFEVPIMRVVAEHLDPATSGWTRGQPDGVGELRAYLMLDDGAGPDPLSLLLAVDALPPASFDLGLGGWVPTLQLSAWVRGVPAAGPLVVRQRARLVQSGLFDETCDVWDSRGHLVATGHQLAGVRLPRG